MRLNAFACALAALVCSCNSSTKFSGDDGAVRTTLLMSASDPDLAALRVDVYRGQNLVATQTITPGVLTLPGGKDTVIGGDALFVLKAGPYHVVATALDAFGKPSPGCTSANGDASVKRGETTEIQLSLFCGNANGGLDVIVTVQHDPIITRLRIDPNKFTGTCDPIVLTVSATDPDGDALSYAWSAAGPANAVFSLTPDRDQAVFEASVAGEYSVTVKVVDSTQASAGLTVPIHVSDGPLCKGEARRPLLQTLAEPQFAEGGKYPTFMPFVDHRNEDEEFEPRVATGPLRGDLSPHVDGTLPPQQAPKGIVERATAVQIPRNTAFGTRVSFSGSPPDMSGASGGGVVLAAGNTFGALSTDAGASFNQLIISNIFPSGPTVSGGVTLDGGLCCDQVVQYVPQINRFVWLQQFWGPVPGNLNGPNMFRLASASPEQIIASGGTSWTYWDLRSGTFGLGNTFLDYPDMSVGDNFINVSIDAVGTGLLVMRIPLAQIRDSQTILIEYTNPPDGNWAYGGHLTQNTRNELFWAGHLNNSRMRLYSMREGDGFYAWRDRDINSWPNSALNGPTPSGANWLSGAGGFPGSSVLGGTRILNRSQDDLWFAWTAGSGGNFPLSHIQIVRFNHAGFTLASQMQVWNTGYSFGYPSIATNDYGEVGMSLGFAGGGWEATHAVGFWGDFLVYPSGSSAYSETRWGDYVSVRRDGDDGGAFAATGYVISQPAGSGAYYDPHFVRFVHEAPGIRAK